MFRKVLVLSTLGLAAVGMATGNTTNYIRGNGMALSGGNKAEFRVAYYDYHNESGTTGKGQFRIKWNTGTRQATEVILGVPGRDVVSNMTISGNTATLSGKGAVRFIAYNKATMLLGTVSISITDGSPSSLSLTFIPDDASGNTTFSGNVTHGSLKVGAFTQSRP